MSIQLSKREKAEINVKEQERWIAQCGGNLEGYIKRYGPADADPYKPVNEGGRYGLGGPAIYAADKEHLRKLVAQLAATPEEPAGQQVRVHVSLDVLVDRDAYLLNYGPNTRQEIVDYVQQCAKDAVEYQLNQMGGWLKEVRPR